MGANEDDGPEPLFTETFEETTYADRFTTTTVQGTNDALSTDAAYAGDSSLRVAIPEGESYGIAATMDPVEAGVLDAEPLELRASYWVHFDTEFDLTEGGGRLPGFANLERATEDGDPASGENGWIAHGYFGQTGDEGADEVVIGAHHTHMDMDDGADQPVATTVSRGEWVHIEQRVKLNTVSEDDGSATDDGELQVWVFGERHINNTNLRYTLHPDDGVNFAFIIAYNDAAPTGTHVYVDDWALIQPTTADSGDDGDDVAEEDEPDVVMVEVPDTALAAAYGRFYSDPPSEVSPPETDPTDPGGEGEDGGGDEENGGDDTTTEEGA